MLFNDSNLQEKMEELEYFVKSNPTFLDLPEQEQDLLEAQLGAMQAYLAVLKMRLKGEKPEQPKKVTFTATITSDFECDAAHYRLCGQLDEETVKKVEEQNMKDLGDEYFARQHIVNYQVTNVKIQ